MFCYANLEEFLLMFALGWWQVVHSAWFESKLSLYIITLIQQVLLCL